MQTHMSNKDLAGELRQRIQAMEITVKMLEGEGSPKVAPVAIKQRQEQPNRGGKRKMSAEALKAIRAGQQKRRERERKEAKERNAAIEATHATEQPDEQQPDEQIAA